MNERNVIVTKSIFIDLDHTFVEGYVKNPMALTTDGYAQGSNLIAPNGDWYFFDETAGWSVMLNIKES